MDKTCTKCNNSYPATTEYFGLHKGYKNGLCSWCKRCCSKAGVKYSQTEKGRCSRQKARKNYRHTLNGYLHRLFDHINQRCNNPSDVAYRHYGGRGIKNKFKSFDELADYINNDLRVDPRGFDMDRIDNNGNYEKGNIRFVTHAENLRNRRPW